MMMVGYVTEALHLQNCMQDFAERVKRTVRLTSIKMSQRLINSYRHLGRFFENKWKWLKEKVNFPYKVYQAMPSSSQRVSASIGRPTKPFVETSSKSKTRKIKSLLHSRSVEEVTSAAQMDLTATGKRDSANTEKELHEASPQRRRSWKGLEKYPTYTTSNKRFKC